MLCTTQVLLPRFAMCQALSGVLLQVSLDKPPDNPEGGDDYPYCTDKETEAQRR